jgi:hypothetical protein
MFIQIILDCDTHRSCKQTQAALDSLSLGVPGRRRHRRRRFRFFCRRAFLPTHANLSTSKQRLCATEHAGSQAGRAEKQQTQLQQISCQPINSRRMLATAAPLMEVRMG